MRNFALCYIALACRHKEISKPFWRTKCLQDPVFESLKFKMFKAQTYMRATALGK